MRRLDDLKIIRRESRLDIALPRYDQAVGILRKAIQNSSSHLRGRLADGKKTGPAGYPGPLDIAHGVGRQRGLQRLQIEIL